MKIKKILHKEGFYTISELVTTTILRYDSSLISSCSCASFRWNDIWESSPDAESYQSCQYGCPDSSRLLRLFYIAITTIESVQRIYHKNKFNKYLDAYNI